MYQEGPQFPAIEQGNAGERVVLEGVKVAHLFELAQGNGWTRQDMKVELNGTETKVKYWRPEKVLAVGQIVTVVGVIEEYMGKRSLSVDAKKGGGIAADGEPLASPTTPQQVSQAQQQVRQVQEQGGNQRQPATVAQPSGVVTRKMTVSEYRKATKKALAFWKEQDVSNDDIRPLATSEMIALLRNDITEDPDEDLPF